MKIKSHVGGTNSNAWVHPWERDTTRGAPNLDSCPSLHSSKVEATVKIAVCQCCGVNFGYENNFDVAPAYCVSHRWLSEKQRLGIPLLNGIMYVDDKTGVHVRGNNIRWSYCFLEDDPKVRESLFVGLTKYFKTIEKELNIHFLPRVVKTSRAVMVMDLQRWYRYRSNGTLSEGGPDQHALAHMFDTLDEVYVEAL